MANNNAELVYEFESVTDRDGNSKIDKEIHSNPVYIDVLTIGRSAYLKYVDTDRVIMTSTVESILVHKNKINIKTLNTDYWLTPYIRKEIDNYERNGLLQ